jgi:hypothetical protein
VYLHILEAMICGIIDPIFFFHKVL